MKIVAKLAISFLFTSALLQGCSTPQAMKPAEVLYREGEEAFKNEKYEEAIASWKKVKEAYKSPDLTTKAELNIADAYFLNKDYIEAAAAYEDFRKQHPKHLQVGFALYRQGVSYYNQIHGTDTDQTPVKNAQTTFDSYLKLYPSGEQLAEAQEKLRECRDMQLQYELYVGRFYLKTDVYKAAIARFEASLKMFSDLARREEVLFYLGKAYLKDGQKAKSLETFNLLIHDFPTSVLSADAKDIIASSLQEK